ncbi:MAG: kinase-like domain-containing protein [Benniella sp.]|nr:MAG: kinase-like domain-containing protein [Benniella sp.]
MASAERIGEGFFGAVYKVETGENEFEAHKKLGGELIFNNSWDSVNEMLAREAKIYRDLQSDPSDKGLERIVRFIGVQDDPEHEFTDIERGTQALTLRMEYVERDLQAMTPHMEGCKWDDLKIRIMYEVAEGLELIHKKGYIHADLTFGNILLTKDMHVKICDFGISLKKGKTDLKRGGVEWPPEMQKDPPEYSYETDIWNFAVMMENLWELSEMPHFVRMYIDQNMKVEDMNQRDSATQVVNKLQDHLALTSTKNNIKDLVRELESVTSTHTLPETP